ncbi:hypothetical protein UF37_03000, partial [Vibrio parahaemolyticus]
MVKSIFNAFLFTVELTNAVFIRISLLYTFYAAIHILCFKYIGLLYTSNEADDVDGEAYGCTD